MGSGFSSKESLCVHGAFQEAVCSAACSKEGGRTSQEDRFLVVDKGWSDKEGLPYASCSFFGVFDGHGGSKAAQVVSDLLWERMRAKLIEELPQMGTTMDNSDESGILQRIIREAFAETEDKVKESCDKDVGSTAVCATLLGRRLYVAWAGDSRCVLCRGEKAIRLTDDHKPEVPSEAERIRAAGGQVVQKNGQARLNGDITVSRAFGDARHKSRGLTAEPEIRVELLQPEDYFFILASDGLWNSFSDDDAVQFVLQRLKEKRKKLKTVCSDLVDAALQKGDRVSNDNTTVVITCLPSTPSKTVQH